MQECRAATPLPSGPPAGHTEAPEEMSGCRVPQAYLGEHHCALPTAEGALGLGGQVHGEDRGAGSLPFSQQGGEGWSQGAGSGPSSGQTGQDIVCCIRFQDLF